MVDDGGSLSFISLSKYGALQDEDEVSVMVSRLMADKAEQRTRRKEEQRRRKQQEDEAVALKPAALVPRQHRPNAARPAASNKQKRVREEAKEEKEHVIEHLTDERKDEMDIPQPTAHPPVPLATTPSSQPPPSALLPPPSLLSRFAVSASKLVANSDGSYTVRLQAGEYITFHGSVELRVEYGYVRCNNHVLSPSSPHSPHQLHSPAWHPTALLSIEHYSPDTRHRPISLPADDESIIILSPSSSPHRLHSNPDPTTSYLPIHIPSFHPLQQQSAASHNRQPMAALSIPDDWRTFLDEYVVASAKPGSVLLCGGRNAGKSTLGRLVVNGLLNVCRRVLYVDVDVGQSEFTPASMLSLTLLSAPLLSPPHCHLALPTATSSTASSSAPQLLLSYHCGDVSYTQDPALYLHHASMLWQRVEEERLQRKGELLPVVINTAGWMKGAGAIVLAELIARIKPQRVLYLGDQQADDIPSVTASSTLHILPRYSAAVAATVSAGSNAALSADKSRTLTLLSYFLQRSCPPVSFLTAASQLASLRPYRIPLAAVALQLQPPNERLPHSLYLKAFNATIVALCTSDTAHSISTADTSSGVCIVTSTRSPLPCLGLAIVRAIDASSRQLYLLTPLSLALMRQVKVLVRGTMELPSVLVYYREQDGRGQPYMPNSALSAASGGGSGAGRKGIARKRLAAS